MGSSKKESMAPLRKPLNLPWHLLAALAMAASIFICLLQLLTPTSSSPPGTLKCSDSPPQIHLPGASEWRGDLRRMESAWNRLCFGNLGDRLRIALFVKKWPVGGVPGGLERHALTLHRDLASRGHKITVYTASPPDDPSPDTDLESDPGLRIRFSRPNPGGGFDYRRAWDRFQRDNATEPFDIVHSESVALPHWKAAEVGKSLAASWHGIGYEIIHSELVQDLLRKPGEPRGTNDLQQRLPRVAEEIRFFPSYHHHVATSDYVADVLQTIYQIPLRQVHTILNGVDTARYRPDPPRGAAFRLKFGVPANASFVFGAAGRLVRDKGHPLLYEAFSRMLTRRGGRSDVYLLVAGSGPWGERYRELAPNVKTLGPMRPDQLSDFYNALDVFINPTLRSQGLDHTLLEAMQCGKPLLATHFSSITWSVIVSPELGGTFSPSAEALEEAMERVIGEGRERMREKGERCREYAELMFSAQKMGAAYERLFLCVKNESYCPYPLPQDCPVQPSRY